MALVAASDAVPGAALADWHELVGWVLIVLNAVVGTWCLLAYRYDRLAGRPMWAAVLVAQLSVFVVAALGAILSSVEGRELDDFHALYGFSTIVAVGILASYRTSSFVRGKETLLYGFGSLFIMGLGLRQITG